MLEHKREYACILAFDVPVSKDANEMASSLGVRIFTADIIYHLEDSFKKYLEDIAATRGLVKGIEVDIETALEGLRDQDAIKKNENDGQ